ncbi:hypothetical protein ACIQOV_33045 [Kitasatospora sp. NPDC091257]|uniref:hypothetical protein n=1 Tax=Kitasatospora sp. NPDC091257 TaxID=3364084 RepID=UPI003815E948
MAASTRRQANQARHWNGKQADAQTAADRAAVWWDACRSVAHRAERSGDPKVWTELQNALHDFFRRHSG